MSYDGDDDPYSGGSSYYDGESEDYYGLGNDDELNGDIYAGTTIASSQSQLSDMMSQETAYDQQSVDAYTIASHATSQGSKKSILICPNCGGADFHEASTDGLGDAVNMICSQCFTQTQGEVGASQTDFDTAKKMAQRIGGRIKATSRRKREESKQHLVGDELPSAELCLEGFQHLLIGFAESGAKLCSTLVCNTRNESYRQGSQKEFENIVVKTCGKLWFSWLRQWHKAAGYYSNLYPDCRISIRDAFLTSSVKDMLNKHMERQINLHVNNSTIDECNTNDNDLGAPCKSDDLIENDESRPHVLYNVNESTDHDESCPDVQHSNINENAARNGPKRKRTTIFSIDGLILLINKEADKEKPKRPLSPNECAIRCIPSIDFILSCLLCTFSHLRVGITAATICEWCTDGRLPYLDSFYLLPDDVRIKYLPIRTFFLPNSFPCAAYVSYLSELLRISCTEYIPSLKDTCSSLNIPLVAARLVSDIGLNQTVLDYTLSLMGCKSNLQACSSDKLPVPLHSAKIENITNTIQIGAVVIVACRLVSGWESQKYGFESTKSDDGNVPHARFIPWNLSMLNQLRNGSMTKDYLAFLDDYFIKRYREQDTSACKGNGSKYIYPKFIFANPNLREFTEWLLSENSSSKDIDDICLNSDQETNPMVIPSLVLAEPKLAGSDNDDPEGDINAVGKYVVYNKSNKKRMRGFESKLKLPIGIDLYFSPKSYHPHYSLLVEFISDKLGVEALDLHHCVTALDNEMLDLSRTSSERKKME